ncbi:heavy-metal-associated domain-containing protein [uncultured Sphingomonas sp.]|uniref:heavy-metal-associated domain-containing protein n=1 Tax=uncultured Sphingomonas sp. TaxID=158754 RepID=UPI0035CC8673
MDQPRSTAFRLAGAAALLAAAGAGMAQIEGGDRGVAPIDSSGDFEVTGIVVDVAAKTPDAARYGGWRVAQRKAWTQLSSRLGAGGAEVSDGTLDQLVSAIVVEREQIGPTRYVARLGVLFDRGRVGSLLGIATGATRSAPMLVIPVQYSGGVGQVFEARTQWQQAWARYRTGNSIIDYVRPAGTGADPLVLSAGQVSRPGRRWWRAIIDQYGASDVVIPVVRLYRQYPGGPIVGAFQARWGPDNRYLGSFSLRVGGEAGLPQLLDAGVARVDQLYQGALRSGVLRADPTLLPPPSPTPISTPNAVLDTVIRSLPADGSSLAGAAIAVNVQFETPDAAAVAATEAAVRGLVGVRSATTTSLALGGVSLMRVFYDGDPAGLASSLAARGFQISGGGQSLRIGRAAPAPAPPPTALPPPE